jgi:hypothetical protein
MRYGSVDGPGEHEREDDGVRRSGGSEVLEDRQGAGEKEVGGIGIAEVREDEAL